MGFVPNDRQRQAIEHVSGPMLVVAGAGTGKTTVLAHRIAHLIANGRARPDEILAVTYTEAAAKHLKKKVAQALGSNAFGLNACTFHAYCNTLLKDAGLGFGVLDDFDLWILLRRRLDELPLKHFLPPRDPGEFLEALKQFFSRCHDELVDATRYEQYVSETKAGKHAPPRVAPAKKDALLTPEQKLERCAEIAAVFRKVEEMLTTGKLGTFGHMITGAVRLLREDASVLSAARKKARFILIDEFQDANVAQIELARQLGGDERNVFAVGDPDQAIFHFRGASSAAFTEFLRRFPGSKGVVLNENQRSTSHILSCAHAVIRSNPEVECTLAPGVDFRRVLLVSAREQRAAAAQGPGQKGKQAPLFETLPLFAGLDHSSPLTSIVPQRVSVVLSDKDQEASEVAEEIRQLVDSRTQGTIAVIYRLHSHVTEVACELAARGVPVAIRGIDALETPVGRDLMAVLGAVQSLSNVEDVFRVSALPMFALDAEEVARKVREQRQTSYPTLLANISGGAAVMGKIEAVRSYAASVDWQAVPITKYVVREFDFDADDTPVRRICDFVGFWRQKAITETGTLEEFVKYMELFQQAGGKLDLSPEEEPTPDGPAVQLMTAHSAKGLEFDHVFVLRANRMSFPTGYRETIFEFPRALQEMPFTDDPKQLHDQEERRLFYVAMTRAKDHLSICAKPGTGKKDPTPTGFVRDLMKDPPARVSWTQRNAAPATVGRMEASSAPQSGVATWMLAPPIFVSPDAVLSASAIDAFDSCPLKFKLSREWHLPGPASAALLYGNVVHMVLRDLHEAERQGRPRREAQVFQLFRQLMEEAQFDDSFQKDLYLAQGLRQLTEYLRLRTEGAPLPVLHAEKDFNVRISGVPVRGRMDRVDDGGGQQRIVDFKTGKAFDQDKADKSVQLGIYALAARDLWGGAARDLVIYNLEDNSEIVSHRSAAQLGELECKVREIATAIRESVAEGHFDAKPGFHCKWCDFRNVCPAREQRLYSITRTVAAN